MILRMSQLFLRTLREDPAEAEVASHKLLVRAGYIRRTAPGIYTWLPLGLRVLARIERIVREEMDAAGAQEVHFPALVPREPYERSNRWTEYGDNLFRLKDRKDNDYLLAPTHEELFTLLVKDLYTSYKDLPVTLYQIQTKYRDEARPRAGLLRGREFIMKDAYSFDIDAEGLDASYGRQREAYLRIFSRLGLEVLPVQAMSGAMGGSRSEEFLHPTDIGEDTFVRSPGGYAANVEAVTVAPVDPVGWEGAAAARVLDTPDTPTIETLVAAARERGHDIDASGTLKNVAVAVTHAGGDREIVVVGLPGDRSLDLKRLEASLGWGEVEFEPAQDADLARHGLVKGYIGPGLSLQAPFLGEGGKAGVKYFVDPRVGAGTVWVTGANEPGRHVFGLVAGRDFAWDGLVDAAEVKAGDPAPDGSGPLELARGIEMGHIFQLGTKYAEALDLKVLDRNGKQAVVTMGSYGIGVTRALAALAESNHDERGLMWPRQVAPADVHIVVAGKDQAMFEAAEDYAAQLDAAGISVLLDDRPKASPGVKFGDAELVGIPTILVVGRGLKDGVVELKDRRTGQAEQVPAAEAAEAARAAVAD